MRLLAQCGIRTVDLTFPHEQTSQMCPPRAVPRIEFRDRSEGLKCRLAVLRLQRDESDQEMGGYEIGFQRQCLPGASGGIGNAALCQVLEAVAQQCLDLVACAEDRRLIHQGYARLVLSYMAPVRAGRRTRH